jgi:two-component system response regulator RegA
MHVSLEGGSILVVDADRVFRERLVRALRERGYDAKGAATFEEAVRSSESGTPEFVVLDVAMGGSSELDAAQALRARFPTIARIVVTTLRPYPHSTDQSITHLPKPIDVDDILAALGRQGRS